MIDVSCFRELQGNATSGLRFKVKVQRHIENYVLGQRARSDVEILALEGRVVIEDIILYVSQYVQTMSQANLELEHIVFRAATELTYDKRSSYSNLQRLNVFRL